MERQVSAREQRMTRMICLMCTYTVLCNAPKVLLKMTDFEGELTVVRTLATAIYWSQFSGDFVIYAGSNKQYREAYLLLLNDTWAALRRTSFASQSAQDQGQLQLADMTRAAVAPKR